MIQRLSQEVKIVQAVTITAGAAGVSAVNGVAIDMAGYECCMIVVQVGAVVGGAVTSIKLQQDTAAAFSAPDDLLDSGQILADDADDKVFYIDVARATKDFLRLVVARSVANSTVSAMAFLYRGRSFPTTHGSNVAGELHYAPAVGTP